MTRSISGDRPVLIVGAGIGGLTTALALHQAGIPVRVLEGVRAIRPLGVGINLLPHSVRILTDLGVGPALAATAIETAALAYFNKFGQAIWSEPRGLAAGYPVPQFSIHRGELQWILYQAVEARLGSGAVMTSHELVRWEDTGDEVRAVFVDRDTGRETAPIAGAALIGADGIHSVVRRTMYPDEGPARFSGRTLWRAVTDAEPYLDGRTMVMIGHQRQKFVAYPISRVRADRGRSLVNWIAELETGGDTPPRQDWSREVPKEVFAPAFANWRFDWLDVPGIIAGAETVYEYPMVDRDPLPSWTRGRVTLLGDAAHAMYPIGSNGASQAILDAAALTRRLVESSDVPAALKRYEDDRLGPTAEVVLANRRNGPEQVMQIAEERAPQGFAHIHDVIPRTELEEIAARYKRTAGFSPEQVRREAVA